jgi:hypothetical protein
LGDGNLFWSMAEGKQSVAKIAAATNSHATNLLNADR